MIGWFDISEEVALSSAIDGELVGLIAGWKLLGQRGESKADRMIQYENRSRSIKEESADESDDLKARRKLLGQPSESMSNLMIRYENGSCNIKEKSADEPDDLKARRKL